MTAAGTPLFADWSNFWSDVAAVNALYDLRVIWHRQRSAEQTQQLCRDTFERLVAAEADDWDLSSVAAIQSEVPSRCFWSRTLTEIFEFLGTAFSLAPHAVAQCFEDYHRSLVRTSFRLSDAGGEVKFPVAGWTLLVAMSGAGKSPLMSLVQEVLKSPQVRASFGAARHGCTLGCLPSVPTMKALWLTQPRTMNPLDCGACTRRSPTQCHNWGPRMATNYARGRSSRWPILHWTQGNA